MKEYAILILVLGLFVFGCIGSNCDEFIEKTVTLKDNNIYDLPLKNGFIAAGPSQFSTKCNAGEDGKLKCDTVYIQKKIVENGSVVSDERYEINNIELEQIERNEYRIVSMECKVSTTEHPGGELGGFGWN